MSIAGKSRGMCGGGLSGPLQTVHSHPSRFFAVLPVYYFSFLVQRKIETFSNVY